MPAAPGGDKVVFGGGSRLGVGHDGAGGSKEVFLSTRQRVLRGARTSNPLVDRTSSDSI